MGVVTSAAVMAASWTRARWPRGTAMAPAPLPVNAGATPPSATLPPFPQAVLDTRVELLLAGVWTDVTDHVYFRDGLSITYGHPDETQTANPTVAALTLNNRDGRFSPRNPTGVYFGLLGRNTQMRISLPEGSTYLRLEQDTTSYVSCPDAPRLDITGDIDVRLEMAPSNYVSAVLATKANFAASGEAWDLELNQDGTLSFFWSPDGTSGSEVFVTSTAPIPLGHIAVRATLAVATGTVTFYTAATLAGPWTQLGRAGSGTNGAATSIFNTAAPVQVGYNTPGFGEIGLQGKLYGFQLYSGIGGTLVASPDFTVLPVTTTSFVDSSANIWTLQGTAEISTRKYRCHTEVPAWPPRWDPTGTDVYAPIQGSGLLRRLTQGTPPVQSALYRKYARQSGGLTPVGYWPCEDGANSTSIASGLVGGVTMSVLGAPTFASNSAFACSQPIPVTNGSSWTGPLAGWPATWTSNTCRFLMQVPSAGEANGTVIASMRTSGTVALLDLVYGTGGTLQLIGYSQSHATLFTSGAAGAAVNGAACRVSFELLQAGANITWSFAVYVVNGASVGATNGTLSTATVGAATSVVINPGRGLTATAIGHVSVQANPDPDFSLGGAVNAYTGEAAGVRFARLCIEQGVPYRIYGAQSDTVPMGYQQPGDFVSLLQDCENTDRGLMFEVRQQLALGYRTRPSLFNQAAALALSYTAAQLSPPVEPTDDDQLIQNDIVVTRAGGSSMRQSLASGALSTQAPAAGVGDYNAAKTLSLGADAQLGDAAGWLLHLGTVDDLRYPHLTVNLARTELAPVYYQAQDVGVGDRVTVASTPGWLPPDGVSQIVRGGAEACYGYTLTEAWNCAPEQPYQVAVFDDPVRSRGDTDGSTLAGGPYSPSAASLSVATTGAATGSPLWTTAAAEFPFDIEVGGERMTVTNITGTSSPQTFTVTRSVNGVSKIQTGGTDVRLFQPAIPTM